MDFGKASTDAQRCSHCGGHLGMSWHISALGESFCTRHAELPSCRFCGAPSRPEDGDLCPPCSSEAIRSRRDSNREMPGIRDDMHAIGIRLTVPVRIELTEAWRLERELGLDHVGGATVHADDQVLSIRVVTGLVRREFGQIVVHEAMHAWLVQHRFPSLPEPLCEGLCQAMSYRYIRRHMAEPRARLMARHIRESPDPVYGGGFRAVRASALEHGFENVIDHVRRTGRLP